MSLPDYLLDEPGEWQDRCGIHDTLYNVSDGCQSCEEDASDRAHDEGKERQP